MRTEIELKLLIAPQDARLLLRHPLITAFTRQKFSPQRLLSIYYDTADWMLHTQRIALRLRRSGRHWIQTIKTEGRVSAGLHERPEWECNTTKDTFVLHAIADPLLRKVFANPHLQHALRPIFVTEFSRTRRLLELPSGDVVECALDRGEIRAGEKRLPISEVELELKSGDPTRVVDLALQLQKTLSLTQENVSKAERGYQLVRNRIAQ